MAIDIDGASTLWPKPPRYLVRCLVEDGVWSVDSERVEVELGLVLGYTRKESADYMLSGHHPRKELPRAEMVLVSPGMIVCFQNERDAHWAVRSGKAEGMTPTEVMEALQAAQAAMQQQAEGSEVEPVADNDEGDEDMMKDKLENKAMKPADSKAKPAEKLVPAKGGKKGGK
jgi:hypothetical protein